MRYVDLHIHTYYSDGVYSPAEVVRMAKEAGFSAIAITDHDTVDGINESIEEGKKLGIEVVAGVELSSEENGRDFHILGYLFDHERGALREILEKFKKERAERAKKIVRKLGELGVRIDMDEVLEVARNGVIGRPHIAQVLLKRGYVSSIKEAFDRYIGYESPAYVPKYKLKPAEAIKIILDSRGIPVIAHPGISGTPEDVIRFKEEGLLGVEVWHPEHDESTIKLYMELAKKYNLLMTGGSDFHGIDKGKGKIGDIKLDYSYLAELERVRDSIHSAL